MHQTATRASASVNSPHVPVTPNDHLDLDWRLFEQVETGAASHLYRLWEATHPVVVLGRSTPAADVVETACRDDGVAVLRRFSGGGAVVLGPGCLNYAIAVSVVSRPELADVRDSFRIILGRIASALDVAGLSIDGETDLALAGRKVSGNAQRRGRRALVQHGTLLFAFDARLAARYLRQPARQPAYRAARRHEDFMGNVPLAPEIVRARVESACRSLAR